jgi:hypothetical protein
LDELKALFFEFPPGENFKEGEDFPIAQEGNWMDRICDPQGAPGAFDAGRKNLIPANFAFSREIFFHSDFWEEPFEEDPERQTPVFFDDIVTGALESQGFCDDLDVRDSVRDGINQNSVQVKNNFFN